MITSSWMSVNLASSLLEASICAKSYLLRSLLVSQGSSNELFGCRKLLKVVKSSRGMQSGRSGGKKGLEEKRMSDQFGQEERSGCLSFHNPSQPEAMPIRPNARVL